MSEISIELIFTASVAGIFSAMLFALILYYREHRKARYNEVNNRVELEMLRESLEKKIYELTDKLMSTEDRWEDLNLPFPDILCQTSPMRNLTATICLTIAVLLGSAGGVEGSGLI